MLVEWYESARLTVSEDEGDETHAGGDGVGALDGLEVDREVVEEHVKHASEPIRSVLQGK